MRGHDDELRSRLTRQQGLLAAVREAHAGPVAWQGHMRLRTEAGESDVLLGNGNLIGKGPSIIDWRTAPLAEVFFGFGEGEDYELDLGDRVLRGRLLEKNLVSFEGGELIRIEWEDGAAAAQPDGSWRRLEGSPHPDIPPRPEHARTPFRSPLEVQLDRDQQAIVDLPDDQHVLILGEAGFGKTTVALHRVVALTERSPKRFKAAVVVPTEGLKRLTELMLSRRGVERVAVFTYEAFASKMARKIFRDLPRRESQNATTHVIRLKRHHALGAVLPEYVRRRPKPPQEAERLQRSNALARRADLEHLFGDSAWMDKVVAGAGGGLGAGAVRDVIEHTKIQFLEPTERELSFVTDRDRLVTADGRKIDEGTPLEDAASVDPEDYAVLFELERLRAEARGEKPARVPTYDCIVVDEAQEFAPLELSLIGRCVGRGGTVIVAGDAAQQVDATSDFRGWDDVMSDLGAGQHRRATLEVNYRCPPDVTALARCVIGFEDAKAPEREPSIVRAGHFGPLHLSLWLIDQLRDLRAVDPTASIAVIVRSAPAARGLANALEQGLTVRLSLHGEFEFRPGVLVTSVEEVKGLEFDYVVLPDLDVLSYPALPEARRALYVAVTRATHRLALATAGKWTPVIPAPHQAARAYPSRFEPGTSNAP